MNRSPYKKLNGLCPEEIWSNEKPDLSYLKVFGCRAQLHIPKQLRKKWDEKTEECIFLGYSEDAKGYRLWQKNKEKITRGRDVTFLEIIQKEKCLTQKDSRIKAAMKQVSMPTEDKSTTSDTSENLEEDTLSEEGSYETISDDSSSEQPQVTPTVEPRCSTRIRSEPAKYRDYVANFVHQSSTVPETYEGALATPVAGS